MVLWLITRSHTLTSAPIRPTDAPIGYWFTQNILLGSPALETERVQKGKLKYHKETKWKQHCNVELSGVQVLESYFRILNLFMHSSVFSSEGFVKSVVC